MLATAIIIFREVIEIALIVGVVLAATRGVAGRNLWVIGGLGAGVMGAGLLALFAGAITSGMEGMGQQVLNGSILSVAALMIGWTVIWMKNHARELTARIKKAGAEISEGNLPLYSIAVIIALAVLREGAEIVLFLFGLAAAKDASIASMAAGGLIGFAAGAIIGTMFYLGLLKLSRQHLFTTTSLLLSFLAAGMAAQSAGFFSSAGMLPELVSPLWDSSWLLSEGSLVGRVLHALIGYTSRPTGMQIVFYAGTLLVISGLVFINKQPVIKKA